MEITNTESAVILSALRHLQGAVEAGEDLSYLEMIIDKAEVSSLVDFDFESLIEKVNAPDSEVENKKFLFEAMSSGKNPKGIILEVEQTGESCVNQGVGIYAKTCKHDLAYITVGIDPDTEEFRVKMTADANQSGSHIGVLGIFRLKKT